MKSTKEGSPMTASTLLLVVVLSSQTKVAGSSWVEVVSKDGAFSFAMPAKPVEKTVTQKAQTGPIEILDYSCTHGDCLYRIEKTKVPVEIPDDRHEAALIGARDSIGRKTKMLEDKKAVVAGWPARELLVEAPLRPGAKPSEIAMLICYVDSDFYQVRVFALKPGMAPRDVRKFFDSFKPKKARENAQPKTKN
jgi:hypothetical protein